MNIYGQQIFKKILNKGEQNIDLAMTDRLIICLSQAKKLKCAFQRNTSDLNTLTLEFTCIVVVWCGVGIVQRWISPYPRRPQEQETVTHVSNLTPLHILLLFVHWCVRQSVHLPAIS